MLNAGFLLLLAAPAAEYDLGPAPGNRFALIVEKTGLYSGKKHVFEFERYHGKLAYDPAAPERARVELTVEAASAVLKDDWVSEKDRVKILRTALDDMMDARHHPQLRFTSSSVKRTAENSFVVQGMLTIRGIAKPAAVLVKIDGSPLARITGRATVALRDYGLKPPSALLGAIGTKNEMTAEFTLAPQPNGGVGP